MSSRTPRASLSITLLTDEDYRLLVSRKGGTEAFGVFCSMILVGRHRLQEGKARQIEGTDSLVIDNSIGHLLSLCHLRRNQLDFALEILKAISQETRSEPWMLLNPEGLLVIRSFFKFNGRRVDSQEDESAGGKWGGNRPGAGRPKKNQDGNQVENKVKSSEESRGCASSSYPYTSSLASADLNSPALAVVDDEPDPEPEATQPVKPGPTYPNHPDDVRRVAQRANERVFGWGPAAEEACRQFKASWVEEAVQTAFESKSSRFKYVLSILARYQLQGCSDAERPRLSRAAPAPPEEPRKPFDAAAYLRGDFG